MTQPSSGSCAAVWSESTPHLHFSARWNKSALNFSVSLVRDEELDELFNTNGCQVPDGQMSKWWMRKSAVNINYFSPESCRKAAACALTLRASSFRPRGVLTNLFHCYWFRFPNLTGSLLRVYPRSPGAESADELPVLLPLRAACLQVSTLRRARISSESQQ